MEPEVFNSALGMIVITYQTFVVRTPRYTILVDTCTGEDKGHPPPFDFPGKERWRNELFALGVSFEQIDYVFCTHLHIDHTGWNTTLRDGRWVPTFPNAKYIFHKREYAVWEAETRQGRESARHGVPRQLPADRRSRPGAAGRRRLRARRHHYADADAGPLALPLLRQHLLARQARGRHRRHDAPCDPVPRARLVGVPDWDPKQAAVSRRKFLSSVAETDTLILPIHFPAPTAGFVTADGDRFNYRYKRD